MELYHQRYFLFGIKPRNGIVQGTGCMPTSQHNQVNNQHILSLTEGGILVRDYHFAANFENRH